MFNLFMESKKFLEVFIWNILKKAVKCSCYAGENVLSVQKIQISTWNFDAKFLYFYTSVSIGAVHACIGERFLWNGGFNLRIIFAPWWTFDDDWETILSKSRTNSKLYSGHILYELCHRLTHATHIGAC